MAQKRRRFADRRRACGYSQEAFAEAIQVDRTTVVRWECGETEPQPWHRPKIARVFHVSLDELLGLFTDGGGAAGDVHVPERGGAEGMERAAGVRAAFRPSWAKLVCVRELDQRLPQPASASG